MNLVFFGTGPFAVPALRRLASSVRLVVSQPDRPTGRGLRVQPTPVRTVAEELGLPILSPDRCRDPEFIAQVESLAPDALVVASYGQIMPTRLLDTARRGGINLHGSLLPKYRGAAPIQRAIERGEAETGVTLMQMAKGMDTGDMIAKAVTPIGPDETAGELFARLADLAADLAEVWMPRIVAGDYPREPQDERQATYAPKIEKAEAEMNLGEDAEQIYRKFRAFTPAPGPFIRTRLGHIRVRRARLGVGSGPPGTLLAVNPVLLVAARTAALELHEVQPEGKRAVSGSDFANGARLRVGDSLI